MPSRLELDPTRQAGNRRKANATLKKRLAGAKREVNQLVESFRVEKTTVPDRYKVNAVRYEWLIDEQRLAGVDAEIKAIISRWFGTQTEQKPARWFFDSFLSSAYTQGTAESANRIAMLGQQAGVSSATLSQLQVESILLSAPYRRRIEFVFSRAFNNMKGFTDSLATDLGRILADTVTSGQSPRQAQRQIKKRFDVSEGRAERIARTEINRAYTNSRMEQGIDARDRLGIQVMLMHRSALIATTRATHARRHGQLYTFEEQMKWWDEGSNRINCLCGVTEVVVENGAVYDQDLQQKLIKQRMIFFKI